MNLFDYSNIPQISDLVRDQFPQFYLEDGPVFVEFLEAYYEWLQSPDQVIGRARGRYENFDIDTAEEEFLLHFRKKYMWNLPPELLGNQRLLQKHIIELYRSKGSQHATRLLFRLLFNEDIDFYIPSYDIFKLSDNTWNEPHYIEITVPNNISAYLGKSILGSISGSTAIVENYQSRIVSGAQSYILFISNIRGSFEPGEMIYVDGIDPTASPSIVGSVVGVDIITSSPGIYIGDTLISTLGDIPVEIVVTETFEGSGTLEYNIVKSGSYYSLDAVITEKMAVHGEHLEPIIYEAIDSPAYGFVKDPMANSSSIISESVYWPGIDNIVPDHVPISGAGGEIKIRSIRNPHNYDFNSDELWPFANVGFLGTFPFVSLPTSDLNTIMEDSLNNQTVVVGEIETITVLNPGFNYSNDSWFVPIDPYTSDSGIVDVAGEKVGRNGLIVGVPQLGTSIASGAQIITSGYNNTQWEPNSFVSTANNELLITAKPIVGGVGWSEGYYENTKSFLSDDKYLYDGHYYQDYSYVIRAATSFEKYIEILKEISHPAGNAVYGDIRIVKRNNLNHDAYLTQVVKRPI